MPNWSLYCCWICWSRSCSASFTALSSCATRLSPLPGVLGTSERKVRLSHRQRLLRRCTSYSWSTIGLRNGRSSPRATVSGIANEYRPNMLMWSWISGESLAINLGMDTQTPTGKLMLTVLGGVAQFEREMMLERQREGIAKAKSAGKYKGRKPITLERRQHVLRLADEGATKISIARQLGIGEATVYRILAVAKK